MSSASTRTSAGSSSIAGSYRKILITGDRAWGAQPHEIDYLRRIINALPKNSLIIHGGARGADMLSDEAARFSGLPVARVDANWNHYKKAAGPIRNRWMLDGLRPDYVIAFHRNITLSKGTADCIDGAVHRTIPGELHDGRGSITPWPAAA